MKNSIATAAGGGLAGLLFGAGLALSGMIYPAKVLGFLDVAGAWDPTLAFVMIGALTVTAFGYRATLRRSRPLLAEVFSVPNRSDIDIALVVGAAVFGVGWGLGGYCPGPALAGLFQGAEQTIVFVGAMVIGMVIAREATSRLARRGPSS